MYYSGMFVRVKNGTGSYVEYIYISIFFKTFSKLSKTEIYR